MGERDFKKVGCVYLKELECENKKVDCIVDKMLYNFEMFWMMVFVFLNVKFIYMK